MFFLFFFCPNSFSPFCRKSARLYIDQARTYIKEADDLIDKYKAQAEVLQGLTSKGLYPAAALGRCTGFFLSGAPYLRPRELRNYPRFFTFS